MTWSSNMRDLASSRGEFARFYDQTCQRAYGVALFLYRDEARAANCVRTAYRDVWNARCADDERLSRLERQICLATSGVDGEPDSTPSVTQRQVIALVVRCQWARRDAAGQLGLSLADLDTTLRDGLRALSGRVA
jgi:hypothetical protein